MFGHLTYFRPQPLYPLWNILSEKSWCCSHAFWETNSLRWTMQIVECSYYTGGPKAESPLSEGPQPAFVKIFYTPCVRV